MFRLRFGRRADRVLADDADNAWLRSFQKEAESPESFLELLRSVRIAGGRVQRH